MFKNSLTVSVIFHLLLFSGLELVSNRPLLDRTVRRHSPLFLVALVSEPDFETSDLSKNEINGKNGSRKIQVRSGQISLKECREEPVDLSAAEETPPAVFPGSQEPGKEVSLSEPVEIGTGLTGSDNLKGTDQAEIETIDQAGDLQNHTRRPDRLPVKYYAPSPDYPYYARQNQWEGVVLLGLQIRTDGKIGEVKILQSSGYPILDRAAVKAVKRWQYRPALKNGIPCAWEIRVRIKFVLEG